MRIRCQKLKPMYAVNKPMFVTVNAVCFSFFLSLHRTQPRAVNTFLTLACLPIPILVVSLPYSIRNPINH